MLISNSYNNFYEQSLSINSMPLIASRSKNLGEFIQDQFWEELIRDELFSDGTCEVRIRNFPVNIPKYEIEEKIFDFCELPTD